jgi:multidrug efflux pump subunit AcrA (membrane-fusion protein)
MAEHLGTALHHSQAHERIFLLPLWELLGNWKARLKGRRMAQLGAALVAALVLILALVVVPWDYRVSGKGRLMPIDRRGVFAPSDGEVVELPVRSGQLVRQGDLLVRLKNIDLQARLLAQKNLLEEKQKQRATFAAQMSESATAQNSATGVELLGKISQLKVEIEGTQQQVESLGRQVEALSVRAPIAGVVATFRIEEMLRERPVKRGDLLLEVMDPEGPWRLELDVPENRLGHILQAQGKHADGRLPVRYLLATATEATYDGSLDSISMRSVISETEGSVIPLYASLSDPSPAAPRIGADVIAKIDCGRKSLGYVLFGDVIEFVRKRFWL